MIQEIRYDERNENDRYIGFDPPIWEPMEISFECPPLTDEQIDALFPMDQLGDDPRWVEAVQRIKEKHRRERQNAGHRDHAPQ